MWKLLISAAENSNKFQKTRFWKEKSVEDVITFGPMAQATLIFMISKLKANICLSPTHTQLKLDRIQ